MANELANVPKLPAFTESQLQLIQKTVAADTVGHPDEFNLFMEICKQNGLDPFKKHIYAFVFKKQRRTKVNGQWTSIEDRKLTPVTGIDGYRSIAQRSGTYRPADKEPEIEYDESIKCADSNPEGIVKCTVVVYQWGRDNQYHPVVGSARWKEYAPIVEDGDWVENQYGDKKFQGNGKFKLDKKKPIWREKPTTMLAKCAEAQALRKGWEMGGLYVHEEIDRAQSEILASEQVAKFEEEERLKRVAGGETISINLAQSDGLQLIPVGQFFDRVMEHVNQFERAEDILFWQDNQKEGLKMFWVRCEADSHELKKAIEQRVEQLQKQESAIVVEAEEVTSHAATRV